MKKIFLLLLGVLLISCSDQDEKKNEQSVEKKRTKFELTIDWVPSPEYYGYFVAKSQGLYKKAGLDVTINYGSGAPVVANQIATNTIYAGTTTSDNLLRQVALGGRFYKAVPILKFNPSVLVSYKKSGIPSINHIEGKVIGVNKQSSVYQQFQYI